MLFRSMQEKIKSERLFTMVSGSESAANAEVVNSAVVSTRLVQMAMMRCSLNLTVRRISGRARTSPHDREARASGLLWFAPLGCHTSAGWPLSRPSQCAHWLALRSIRQYRPALTADGQRSMFPARGANLFNVRCDSHSVTEPAA